MKVTIQFIIYLCIGEGMKRNLKGEEKDSKGKNKEEIDSSARSKGKKRGLFDI